MKAQTSWVPSCGWGGRRPGAGRPRRGGRGNVAHRAREAHHPAMPAHVTLRTRCRSLRTQFVFPTVRKAISTSNRKAPDDFRVCEFSVQGDHIHMLVEARDGKALSRGIQGLCVRIAKWTNRLLSMKGRFFADRYHCRTLRSPRHELSRLSLSILKPTQWPQVTERAIAIPAETSPDHFLMPRN